jgi:hypothetical protein
MTAESTAGVAAADPATDNVSAPAAAVFGTSRRTAPPQSREQTQLAKLREANAKYKNLLKLAKERIQEQEGLLDERRCK